MASIIRIKRSSGTAKPASLNWGEMAYVTGIGQYGGANPVSYTHLRAHETVSHLV